MLDERTEKLLEIIVDLYIKRWEPIGSKILYRMNLLDMAPSTLRKYMNILESLDYVFQPYFGAWRVPTLKGFSYYIDKILKQTWNTKKKVNLNIVRNNLRELVEKVGTLADWVVVGFLKNDEYYYLGIQNLLKRENIEEEYWVIQRIVEYIETKKIIDVLSKAKIRQWELSYTFIRWKESDHIVIFYWLIDLNWYKALIAIISPVRSDYKKNISLMKNILKNNGIKNV